MQKKIVITFIFLNSLFICSQIKVDTSFTLQSEFLKQSKKFPFIKKVVVGNSPLIDEKKNIIYKALPKRNLHLDAFITNNSKEKLPAVLFIHGGGWKSGSKEMQNSLAKKMASNGYQTFTIEYRLSGEAQYPAGIDDIRNAIDFIKKNAKIFKIDSNKIAILGCSSGAQMASLIGTKYPNEVNAVINIDGILAFHHPDSEEGKTAALWLGGNDEEIPEVWNEASALSHVSKKTPPFLLINSQFKRFSAGQNEFIAKLKTFGINYKVEKIENSPHTFWLFEPWFEPTIKYITNFLNLNFKKSSK